MLSELTKEQLLPAGFTVRPTTMADVETAVSLMNACSQAQFCRNEHNVTDVKIEWSQEKFNLETHTLLVFSPQGELVGYLEVWDTQAVPVHPWRRRGIALALLHHSFAELYKRGKKQVGLGVDAQSLTGATRLYEKAGMYVFRDSQDFEKILRLGRDLSTQSLDD